MEGGDRLLLHVNRGRDISVDYQLLEETNSDLTMKRSKHIDICFHYTRDIASRGTIKVQRIPSKDNAADGLIKLLREIFKGFMYLFR